MRWNAVHASQKVLDLLGKEGIQAVLDTIDHDKVKCHFDKPGMVIPVLHKRSGSSLILIIEVETRIALLQTSEQYESFLAYMAEQEKTGELARRWACPGGGGQDLPRSIRVQAVRPGPETAVEGSLDREARPEGLGSSR